MEDEGIGLALAKAVDLRIKISSRIHKSSGNNAYATIRDTETENGEGNGDANAAIQFFREQEKDDDEEILLLIRDALESLENQLSHLQDLQQQQLYEREVARAEIEQSRQKLFRHLKDYKGEDLQVIREASAFVRDTLERDEDLMLPPYRRVPQPLFEPQYLPRQPTKPYLNGAVLSEGTDSSKRAKSGWWLGRFLGVIAKTMITVVGVVSVLNMSGYKPMITKNLTSVLEILKQRNVVEKRRLIECPPGRTLVVEDGEAHCVVKERIVVPFDSPVANPHVHYGCG